MVSSDGDHPMIAAHRAIVVSVVVSVAAFLPSIAAAQTALGFKTPSNNIFCIIEPADETQPDSDLRCDIQQTSSKPPPIPKDCPLSWGDAFSIGQNGNSGIRLCHGDTTRNDELMALPYGSVWNQGSFSCKSQTSGLTCVNRKGHGFMISRAVQKVF